jgi:hypothetical protein
VSESDRYARDDQPYFHECTGACAGRMRQAPGAQGKHWTAEDGGGGGGTLVGFPGGRDDDSQGRQVAWVVAIEVARITRHSADGSALANLIPVKSI